MNQRRSLLLLAMLLLGLAALLVRPEYRLNEMHLPPALDARQNDLLALERLLDGLGADARSLPQLTGELPAPEGATLWLAVPGRMLGENDIASLLDWVRAGGRLILAPNTATLWENDPLLAAAGLELVQWDEEEMNDALGEPDERPSTYLDGFLYALDERHALRAEFDMQQSIEPYDEDEADGEWLLCDPVGCHAWRMLLERGEILALSETEPFRNHALARHDHAALATFLLAPAPGREFWLVHEEQVPTLFALLRQHAGFMLLALAAAVLLWIVAAGRRFGPLLADAQAPRRRLAEHIAAAGALLARGGRRRELWQAVHDDFLRTLRRRHPQAHDLDAEATIALVARQTGVERAAVHGALAPSLDDIATDAALAAAIRRLDTLRRLL